MMQVLTIVLKHVSKINLFDYVSFCVETFSQAYADGQSLRVKQLLISAHGDKPVRLVL